MCLYQLAVMIMDLQMMTYVNGLFLLFLNLWGILIFPRKFEILQLWLYINVGRTCYLCFPHIGIIVWFSLRYGFALKMGCYQVACGTCMHMVNS